MELISIVRANKERALSAALWILGLVVLLLGYRGISGTGLAAEQNPYLVSGGMFGLALIGIGATLWLSTDLQDDWRKLDALEEAVRALSESGLDQVAEADLADVLVTKPGRAPAQRPRPGRPRSAVRRP